MESSYGRAHPNPQCPCGTFLWAGFDRGRQATNYGGMGLHDQNLECADPRTRGDLDAGHSRNADERALILISWQSTPGDSILPGPQRCSIQFESRYGDW